MFKYSNKANDFVSRTGPPCCQPYTSWPQLPLPTVPLATSHIAISTRGSPGEGKQLETNIWGSYWQVDQVEGGQGRKKEAVAAGSGKIFTCSVSFIHQAHRLFTVDRISQPQKMKPQQVQEFWKHVLNQSKKHNALENEISSFNPGISQSLA